MDRMIKLKKGYCNIEWDKKSELRRTITFNIDISTYTFESRIQVSEILSIDITVTPIDLHRINISLTLLQLQAIPKGKYSWYLRCAPSSGEAIIIEGDFKI